MYTFQKFICIEFAQKFYLLTKVTKLLLPIRVQNSAKVWPKSEHDSPEQPFHNWNIIRIMVVLLQISSGGLTEFFWKGLKQVLEQV